MAKKILKSLTNNLGFKILAVIFATMLWIVVYNIDDPTKSKNFTTVVEIQKANSIISANKYFEVVDGTNQVTFKVTAKRSVLDKLEDNDFSAIADMSKLVVEPNGNKGSVPIEIRSSRYSGSITIGNGTQYLRVELDDLMSKQFVIDPATVGSVAEGYALGAVSITSNNVIQVSGPASIVGMISKVTASINVEGMSQDLFNNSIVPMYYDADDNVIDTTKLTLSNTTCTMSVKILSVKEILLHFETSGAPADSYSVVDIKSEPSVVKVKGASASLNRITTLDVPGEALNVSDLNQSLTTTVNVAEYLPEGVSLVDGKEANVTVTVRLEPYQTKNYFVSTGNITVQGLKDGYELKFKSATVTVPIAGIQSDLDVLRAADIKAALDVTGLSEGEHTAELTFDLDEEKYAISTVRIPVTLAEKTQEDEENPDNLNSGSQSGGGTEARPPMSGGENDRNRQ